MPKKLTMTQQWILDHPTDQPCPSHSTSAKEWRFKRFVHPTNRALWEKYDAAMKAKREYEAKHGPTRPRPTEQP